MIATAYFLTALIVFLVWFNKFWRDETTPKQDRISWVALAIGPLFWPIVLPLSIWELVNKKRKAQLVVESDHQEKIS